MNSTQMPSDSHRSSADFINELISSSLRPRRPPTNTTTVIKKTSKKGKRPKRLSSSVTYSIEEEGEPTTVNGTNTGEEEEAPPPVEEDEWEASSYPEVMRLAQTYHREQGLPFAPMELGVQSDQPLMDDPDFDDVVYNGDCVGCSRIFASPMGGSGGGGASGPFNAVKEFSIPRINEFIYRLSIQEVPVNTIANIIHQYYVATIYKPLIHSGHLDTPLWRTLSIKMHIEGHIDHPRMVLRKMCQRVVNNLNVIDREKYLKSKSRRGVVKTDKEALEKEEKQIKLLLHLKSKDPASMSFGAVNGPTDSMKKILEDMGMGIKDV